MLTRFYVLVKTWQQNKQLAEWLVYSDSSNKHYRLLPLLPPGHLCSRNNSLLYNPSFLHSLLFAIHRFSIASGLAVGVSHFFGEQAFSSLVVYIFVTHSFCHKMVSIIHSCIWCFYSSMASVLRMQSQLWMCILSVHGAIESKRRLGSCCIGASRAIPLFILFLPYCVRI